MKIKLGHTTLIAAFTFVAGIAGGYVLGRGAAGPTTGSATRGAGLDPYTLPVAYGDLGPRLLDSGAIDHERLAGALAQSTTPLTPAQEDVLREGSSDPIVIDRANALFLLDFFWALGLANRNAILTEGPMVLGSGGQIDRYASTGGRRYGAKPIAELYAGTPLVTLMPGQQIRLERVAAKVYRPCCDNPTLFRDCNHGTAMLGMLTLLASRDAQEDEMLAEAKHANAAWFPEEYQKLAVFFSATEDLAFRDIGPEELLGVQTSSRTAYEGVRGYLDAQGLLDVVPAKGSSAC